MGAEAMGLADEAVALVRRWLRETEAIRVEPSARRLAGLLADPGGLEFAVGFVDGVVRPEDVRTAAVAFRRLARRPPAFLSPTLRAGLVVGGLAAPVVPGLVVRTGRVALRRTVAHLVLDAEDPHLARGLRRVRATGARPNVNLLGEAVLGPREAARRLDAAGRLLARDDVDYISLKVSAAVAPHSPWAFDEAVDEITDTLTPLYEQAAAAGAFVNLDMEEYRDLDLTIAVFRRLLDRPALHGASAGIALQAYLPDAIGAYDELRGWAARRRAAGGAPVTVRVVKGANLPMEHVDAEIHGWPLATWASKQETDTAYKLLLDRALRAEHVADVQLGVAGHNLFDLAFALLLARRRGVEDGVRFEALLGMAPAQSDAVRREAGDLLLYTPVVAAADFDSAIAYLVRRLDEGATPDNFLSAAFRLHDEPLFAREEGRFRASLAALDDTVPAPNRRQDRTRPAPEPAGFANAPDTDPAIAANRTWARDVLGRARHSTLGRRAVGEATARSYSVLSEALDAARGAAPEWAGLGGEGRAAVLRRAAATLESRRGELIEVMAAEAGKTFDQGDPEVSEAVDFARYYAQRATDTIDGAVAVPAGVTLVVPPWNFPLAIPAGSTLAALASGSAVVLKPSRRAARTAALLADALWEAGVPREVLRFVALDDPALGSRLVADPRVDQVILTGGYETAEAFRTIRPGLRLLAETSGKNAIVVTPSADLDLAARDVAASAFGHAGQKCSAASLAILVGPVARSARFRDQLLDAVDALVVGEAWAPTTRMGPLIAPAEGKLLDALTRLEPGERWVREPRRLDEAGRLWTPGVKTTAPGSSFHRVECFGPVLGILTARTLDEAIDLQNAVAFGLTAGLHSLDADEIAHWVDRVEAGNLYVNRGITGAIVRRQPFGGWKRSVVGPGAKAGGPNYLLGLGSFRPAESASSATAPLEPSVRRIAEALPDERGRAFLVRAAASDRRAWDDEFGVVRDVSGLAAERNAFRYLPVPVVVRGGPGAAPAEVLRAVLAGLAAGSPPALSTAEPLAPDEVTALRAAGVAVRVEDDATWVRSAQDLRDARVRLVGGRAETLLEAIGGRCDVTAYDSPVTEAGRVELLPFLREQAISVTAHRFGTPSRLVEAVPLTG